MKKTITLEVSVVYSLCPRKSFFLSEGRGRGRERERKAHEYGAIVGRRPVIIKTSKSSSLSNGTRALLCFNIRLRIMCLLEVEGSSTVTLVETNIANLDSLI